MPSVPITINGRRFEIACESGQEAQLARLARYVDDRVRQLSAAVGQLGDTQLMVMTSLLLADELSDKNDELETFKVENNATVRERRDALLAEKLSGLALEVDKISERLEKNIPDQPAPPAPEAPEDTSGSNEA